MTNAADPIRFGFLSNNWEIAFSHGSIVPVSNLEQITKGVKQCLHEDGYIYPPVTKKVTADSVGKRRTIPKTKRPAHLFCVPPSHDLYVVPAHPEADLREVSAAFILHFLAFIFRTRLQFADWYIDGRIPIAQSRGVYNHMIAGHYLSCGYAIWSGWQESEKRRFINILYMFSRAYIYEWDWEKFIIEYMVLDACWRMGKDLFKFKAKHHQDRPLELCDHFGIKHSKFIDIKKIVELRNDLFHETLWHNDRPCHAISTLGYCPGMKLWMLNEQLIGSFLQLN
jgi:hypothetical protein